MFDVIAPLQVVPGLRHGISTRRGGVSTGPYAALNLGYHVGDDPAAVTENRRRLGTAAGYDPAALVTARQVHGNAVVRVGVADRGRGAFALADAVPDADGLLTAAAGVPLAILVADCAPVLLADPSRRALAVVHAGWRGALGRIASTAARMLADDPGSDPAGLVAGIGPTLCPDCLEVGEEVAAAVEAVFGAAVVRRGPAKPRLDLRAMIAADLAAAGVEADHICAHAACPRCRAETFFSYRGQQQRAGRFALVAWWEP